MAVFDSERPAEGRVRAKFYVYALELTQWGAATVKLRVVTRGEDNKKWAAATPVGEISMSIKNDLAAERFAPGQEWFVTFEPAPMGQEGMGDVP